MSQINTKFLHFNESLEKIKDLETQKSKVCSKRKAFPDLWQKNKNKLKEFGKNYIILYFS